MAYVQNAVNPYFYGVGNPVLGVPVSPIPWNGIREIPVNLNQTFMVETTSFIVPEISPVSPINGFLLTYLNSGADLQRTQMLIDITGSVSTIDAAYDFFNTIPESGAKTDGVLRLLLAGQGSPVSGISFVSSPTEKLISMRGEYTVMQADFPWPYATSPRQNMNNSGIQTGSVITFFTSDNFQLFSFDLPQDIRTDLNTLPV
jgi:hypothetical protein